MLGPSGGWGLGTSSECALFFLYALGYVPCISSQQYPKLRGLSLEEGVR